MNKRVVHLSADNVADFMKVHSGECGWCYCTAWWHPTWEGWTERKDEQNLAFRQELFNKGEYDGYLLYVEDQPAGWCQTGRRDRLSKLVSQYQLQPNPEAWAITCFVIRPEYRKQGCATYLLKVILEDLQKQNVKQVQAFPKQAGYLSPGEHWKGPIDMYLSVGFKVERDDLHHPVLTITL